MKLQSMIGTPKIDIKEEKYIAAQGMSSTDD